MQIFLSSIKLIVGRTYCDRVMITDNDRFCSSLLIPIRKYSLGMIWPLTIPIVYINGDCVILYIAIWLMNDIYF